MNKKFLCILTAFLLLFVCCTPALAVEDETQLVDDTVVETVEEQETNTEDAITAEREIAPYEQYYRVTASALNLREKATSASKSLVVMARDEIVVGIEDSVTTVNGTKWVKIRREEDGQIGYATLSYLKKIAKPNAANLKSIAFEAEDAKLYKSFQAQTRAYYLILPTAAERVRFSYAAQNSEAQATLALVDAEGKKQISEYGASGEIDVPVSQGDKGFYFQLSCGDDTVLYAFVFWREPENMTHLLKLAYKNVPLENFSGDVFDYKTSVPYSVSDTALSGSRVSSLCSYKVYNNGTKYSDSYIPLFVGENVLKCTLTSPMGRQTTYTVKVTREQPAEGEEARMSPLEQSLVEQAFRLLPERHPFVLAYEEAHGVDIKSYTKNINGVRVSGVPFEFGGSANMLGFRTRWWNRTGVSQYPVGGLDCAKFIQWVYKQVGYDVPGASTSLFFSGKTGVTRKLHTGPTHKVIRSLKEAKIGDVAYNSKENTYISGHGSHTVMFLGTAEKLGISETIQKYYPGFPKDAYLVIDTGWADGSYYYSMMRKLGVSGRSSMCGVGIQFFSSIKDQNGKYTYKSPHLSSKKSYTWKDPKTGYSFTIASNLERNSRPVQYKGSAKVSVTMNLSRPINRND